MILISKIARLGSAIDGKPLHINLDDSAVYQLADADSLFGIGDVLVAEVLDVYVAGDAVVEPQPHSGRLAQTGASVKVVPHVGQLGEVVLETERALPQAGLVVTHRVRLVELFALGFSSRYT